MANKNFEVKHGLSVGGTERISSAGVGTFTDLNVTGTTTTIDTATLQVQDKNIVINYGAGDTSSTASGAGITIQDAVDASNDATLLWDSSNDKFDFSHAISAAALTVDNIGIDGSTISNSSGDITLDASGDIILDADGDDIKIAEGGTNVMSIKHESSGIDFSLHTTDEDYKFKGSDGGSTITALHLDISEGGKAIFNDAVTATELLPGYKGVSINNNYAFAGSTVSGAMAIFGHNITHDTAHNVIKSANTGYHSSMIKMYYNQGITFHAINSTATAGDTFYDISGTTNELMRLSNDGKLGIDTTDPKTKLHIGPLSGGDGSAQERLRISGDWTAAGSGSLIRFTNQHNSGLNPNSGEYNLAGIKAFDFRADWGGAIALQTAPNTSQGGNLTDRLVINPEGRVGIGTSDPKANFDVTVPNAKTASASVWGYLGKTNESTNYQALQCFQIGGSAADERRYEFQTIEQGVSNDGIICFQKSGGRLFIGHDSADGNNDKVSIGGSIGIGTDNYIGAGSGWGPNNGAGSSSTIQLYSSSTGNMTFSTNYSAGDEVHNMSGSTKFLIKRNAAGTEAVQFFTQDGGFRVGALNSSYHHFMRMSGPSMYYFDNRCEASGGFHTYSDENLKKEITPITGALDSVAKMNGVTFKWKDAEKRGSGDTGKQFGVTAQNMLEVDSELPSLNVDPLAEAGNEETDEKYYSMDYNRITPFLIEAVKELKTKLEAAEARIKVLEG
tara:strand:+ start:2520 stop:4709 length:2190 start_codon:yes stop_codon:yes gene_type:complete